MLEHSLILQMSSASLAENTTSRLRQEYQALHRLFQAQSDAGQQFLHSQAAALADAILRGETPLYFSLPESVACLPMMDCPEVVEKVIPGARHQRVGGFLEKLTHADMVMALEHRLAELENSPDQSVAVSATLVRYSVALHIIHQILPAGNPVVYAQPEDDDIPNQPAIDRAVAALERSSEAVHQPGNRALQVGSPTGSLSANYAENFFLPQYVVFDDQNRLLAVDVNEAIAKIQALRRYLLALNTAVRLAPYMVVDEEFQARRYGILGQLVNQGRALANYQVEQLCQTIKRRSADHSLDRGLSLSIPFFNDQTLELEEYKFDIIPPGRVMFAPAFVVIAVRAEAKKIIQNTRLNHSVRKTLLQELIIMERAFLR